MGLRDRLVGGEPEPEAEVVPTGRTIDGEVGEVALNLGVENNEPPEVTNELGEAIAKHFGIEPEQVSAFVVTCEYNTDDGLTLSSAWSIVTPAWRLKGMVREVLRHLESL
jgi:hypothetical protein